MNFNEAVMAMSYGKTICYKGKYLIQGKNVKAPKTHIVPLHPLTQPIFIYDYSGIEIWQPVWSDFISSEYYVMKTTEGKPCTV